MECNFQGWKEGKEGGKAGGREGGREGHTVLTLHLNHQKQRERCWCSRHTPELGVVPFAKIRNAR